MTAPHQAGSVLAIMAHPDDAELWAGGTIALHAQRGASAGIAVPVCEPARNAEAAAGAAILGAQLWPLRELTVDSIGDLLASLRPEIVITHPLGDVHPDHRRTCQTVLDALPDVVIKTGHPRRVYTCETYNGLALQGPTAAQTIIDITETYHLKMQALSVHRSQPIDSHFGPMAEVLASLWGARIGTSKAEAFTPIPVLGRLPASSRL